ncbi:MULTISPECIES: NAD(P)/FAD-dependent oxidoreductase [unclassified Sphingopyxis]|uniref:NAD(P)/FAD-dependent oxidoreductase n=1 Tax=unclassified Sphingopyxis TaxID=2614943 RepID=UPI0007373D50|nr:MULTISPECIES: FAD-dependent oxidoreductase [unclassified Sphingopyxis]KTE31492.1 FAD-dependent oxidoreductase [Sphingopyxis sp. HIX]KTE81897.1 FAD-dependent oxidoreductase [Sphingopyxis sp. HXXIV]
MATAPPSDIDVLIVGAGIAGASLAAALAPHRAVLMIEGEDMPGYHATGRSAAFWQESYGGVGVQPLTAASFGALAHPDPGFSDRPFLLPRTALMIGRRDEAAAVDAFVAEFGAQRVEVSRLSAAELAGRIDGLRPEWSEGAYEPSCRDIDVGGLHAAYLRAAKRAGAQLAVRTRLVSVRRTASGWAVETAQGTIRAAVIVNAAGAWADEIAVACGAAPVGIQPYRRTLAQVRLSVPTPAALPLIGHVGGDFYFKGEGEGRIWLSPHDETPSDPCDAAPEEIDVALAIDRLQSVVDWPVAAVERKWAGLRSFAPDRLPVFGPDPAVPGFFWCAGQGGFGIQTAPAIAALAAAQLGALAPAGAIAAIDPVVYAPSRFA